MRLAQDKFGLPWQIVPRIVGDMMSDPDADRANRVMQALLQMTKLDIAALQKAYGHA
jgi:predicted 3-demethylubiquinone-9 3-methyltransferase (glyoxalase superfamily)